MIVRQRGSLFSVLSLLATLSLAPAAQAQDVSDENKGVDSGDYNIRQTVEFGYRGNWVGGNQDNYNTFVNLGAGVRLFEYKVEMRSLDHRGILFDNLSFNNFGYGGDPNNVSRLHISKNKWYDFSALFRRDENWWNYNLFANPLNPASSVPAMAITNSPHAHFLVRRMQDYNLTLLPQSKVRFRLGYSHDRNEGPGFWTTDGGTNTIFNQAYSNTTNAYRAGVDFRFLPRTTFSYDQFLNYYKQDDNISDGNQTYRLSDGRPVDLGIVWDATVNQVPCLAPISDPGTTPPTAFEGCDSYLTYHNVAHPRTFMPAERFSFASSYFRKFEMSGAVGYSSGNDKIGDFSEIVSALTSRTVSLGSTAGGLANSKRVSVNADWSGVYSVTEKFRIDDSFRYDNWRTPSTWGFSLTSLFSVAPPPGGVFPSLLLPVATFNATNCPSDPVTHISTNAATCPQHNDSSDPDISMGVDARFLGQNLKSNTFELEYDFTPRFQARVGYLYTNRKIADFFSVFNTAETFFPGGPAGTATPANLFEAARGDCTITPPATTLPPGCTLNADGSVTFSGLSPTFADTSRGITRINEHALLLGLTARLMDSLRVTGNFEFGYNDNSYARTDPRQVQSYKIHMTYTPRPWVNIDGALDIHENRDNVSAVSNVERDRTYGFITVLSPNSKLTFDVGYSYTSLYSQADICYFQGFAPPDGVTTFPCPSDTVNFNALGALSTYSSKQHFAYFDVMWKLSRRITTSLGYAGTFVGGSNLLRNGSVIVSPLNALQPAGTLAFNYQKPYATVQIGLYKGLNYKMGWNYYGYNGKAPFGVLGLQPIGNEDFNGSTATFGFRFAF